MMRFPDKDQLERMLNSVNLSIEMCRKLDPHHIYGATIHVSHDASAVSEDDEYKTFYSAYDIPFPGENLFRSIFYDTGEILMRSNERDAINDMIKLKTVDDDNFIPQNTVESLIERSPLDSIIVSVRINTRLYEETIRESELSTYADYMIDESAFYLTPNLQRLVAHLVKDENMYHPVPTDLWMKLIDLAEEIYAIGMRDEIYYSDYEVQFILILILLGFADATIKIYPVNYSITGYSDEDEFDIHGIRGDYASESSYRSSDSDETVDIKFDKNMLDYIKKMKGID